MANPANAGLGMSPSNLIAKHLLRGSHLEKTFFLSRSDPDEDLKMIIETEGDEIKNWVTSDQESNFILPAGEKIIPIIIT